MNNTEKLIERRKSVVARGIGIFAGEISADSGTGSTLTDLDGDSSMATLTVTINQTQIDVPLPSSSAVDPWSLVLLVMLPWLRQRRRQWNWK